MRPPIISGRQDRPPTASDDAEAERLFAALSDGGNVPVPMAATPFAPRLGMVADKFGVP